MIETERIICRPFMETDLDGLVNLRSDPDVAKYLGGAKAMERNWNKVRLDFYISCYDKFGFGMHKMYLRETDELIGWSGLQPLQDSDEIEVSYGLKKDFWRKGIGFETAKGWVDFGFMTKGLERIVAVVSPENTGSRRILSKLGMDVEKEGLFYNMHCEFYSISKTKYLGGS